MIKRFTILIILALLPILSQAAVLTDKNGIRVLTLKAHVKDTSLTLSISSIVDKKALKKSQTLILTPIIVSGAQRQEMRPIHIGSRTSELLQARQEIQAGNARGGVMKYTRPQQTFDYTSTIPYQAWMNGADVMFKVVKQSCGNDQTSLEVVALNVVKAGISPGTFISPENLVPAHTIKKHNLTEAEKVAKKYPFFQPIANYNSAEIDFATIKLQGELLYFFPTGKDTIDRDFEGNGERIDRIIEVLSQIDVSNDSKIEKIVIAGFCSPEGSAAFNRQLSSARVKMLKNYLIRNSTLNDSNFVTYAVGSDWNGLRDLVDKSDMQYRDQVLSILNQTPELDDASHNAKLKMLRELKWGVPWKYIATNLLPKLRNAGYIKVYYESLVNPIDVAMDRIQQMIQRKLYQDALSELLTLPDDNLRVTELRGLCYMMTGDMFNAQKNLTVAAKAGIIDAVQNLKQLNKVVNQN